MYENLRREFFHECLEHMSKEDAAIATSVLDICIGKYNVTSAETGLAEYVGNNIPQVLAFYLDCCTLKGLSKGTVNGYKQKLKLFFDTISIPVTSIKRNDIRRFMAFIQTKELKDTTVARYYSTLAAFFNWCQNEEIISANPMYGIEKPKQHKRHKSALSEVEVEKLKSVCETRLERAIIETMLSTGVRVSELCHLKNEDILWNDKESDMTPIKVINGKGGKDRIVYIKDSAMLYLKEYIENKEDESEYVFSHNNIGYGRENIWRICNRLKARAEIKKDFSPHILRHTTASTLCRRGSDIRSVQALLGHSNINTTMIYADQDHNRIMSDLSRFGA